MVSKEVNLQIKNYYLVGKIINKNGSQKIPTRKKSKFFLVYCILIISVSGSNRILIIDNWFSSYDLALNLLKKNKLTIVGTLRKTIQKKTKRNKNIWILKKCNFSMLRTKKGESVLL